MARARDTAEKEAKISLLQEKLEKLSPHMETVEEQLCTQCKKSMEESLMGEN